jgi:hypothetical protein
MALQTLLSARAGLEATRNTGVTPTRLLYFDEGTHGSGGYDPPGRAFALEVVAPMTGRRVLGTAQGASSMTQRTCDAHPPCDQCAVCRKGRCCRKDDPGYALPALGSITPFFGALGERNDAGDRIECHVCGGWYRNVGSHSWQAHDLTISEYRSAFGLGSRGLISDDYRAQMSEIRRIAYAKRDPLPVGVRPTPEQRRAGVESLESRRRTAEARQRALPALLAAAHAPETIEKMRATKRRQTDEIVEDRECDVCGKGYRVVRWKGDLTCSRACRRELRARIARAHMQERIAVGNAPKPPVMTGEIRAALSAKATERWATASDDMRRAAADRLAAYTARIGPDAAREQRRAAGMKRAEAARIPHYCTAGCGTLLPKATPKTCSPECRRIVRQRTARVVIAARSAARSAVNENGPR